MQDTFCRGLSFGYGAFNSLRNLTAAVLLASATAQAEPVTIAALGDSLTAGYGLPQEDGFVPQLQTWLAAQGADAVIANAGVSGDTTAGGLNRVAWTLTPDVDAMIVTLGGNDYLRGMDPAASRANLEAILVAGQAAGVEILMIGIPAGANYGAEYKSDFDSMYIDLAKQYDVQLFPSFFSGLLNHVGEQQLAADFMQPDGIHPNAEGVSLIVESVGPSVLKLIEGLDR